MGNFDTRPNTEPKLPAETTSFLLRLVGQGKFEFDIVAESHYQDSLKELYGGGAHDGHRKKVEALLIYDYANPHDDKAVSVSIDGKTVGFLDRTIARNFRARMNLLCSPGVPAVCEAMIVEGWHGNVGHFGVKLDLPQRSSESVDDNLDREQS